MSSRRRPAHGVIIEPDKPTIVYLTVCTRDRPPWLATAENHETHVKVWTEADFWLVGRYVLMPDHLHLFAAPGHTPHDFDKWVQYWKSEYMNTRLEPTQEWQVNHWDTRLRSGESYNAKWEYVRFNPVRAGLVEKPEDWPFQGELNILPWS